MLAYKVCATTTEPTTMASRAPANRAAPAPVPNNQKERLRLLNSAAVNTSALVTTDCNSLRTRCTSACGK
jgi:hypothetical protein